MPTHNTWTNEELETIESTREPLAKERRPCHCSKPATDPDHPVSSLPPDDDQDPSRGQNLAQAS
jgi:hypothetical protein